MPWSALPDHLNNPEKWRGTDDDTWYMRWRLQIKGWFAYGPRCKEWWASWKVPPKCLLKLGGKGSWRVETDPLSGGRYLSRVQYWKRWHVQIAWPLMFAFHFYFKDSDTLPVSLNSGASVDNKLFYFYIGSSFDHDSVYWFPAMYVGLTWK